MGLDIYLYEVIKPSEAIADTKLFTLPLNEADKSLIALFEHFKDYTVPATRTDFSEVLVYKYLASRGISSDAELVDAIEYRNENLDITCVVWVFDDDTSISVPMSQFDSFYEEGSTVGLYTTTEYIQRKGMRKEFYSEFMSGCWYIVESDNDENDAPNFVYSNEVLEKAKYYVNSKNEPLYNLTLKNNQFIWFWY